MSATSAASSAKAAVTSSAPSTNAANGGAGGGGGLSAENVKVCVRVRPISSGDSAWNIPAEANQIGLMDVKGKLATTYGVGEWLY